MNLVVTIKKITTKEKEGLVTISTTFEFTKKIGQDTSEAVGELSAFQGVGVMLTIK